MTGLVIHVCKCDPMSELCALINVHIDVNLKTIDIKYNDLVRVLYEHFDAKYHLTILSHLAPMNMSLVIIFKKRDRKKKSMNR